MIHKVKRAARHAAELALVAGAAWASSLVWAQTYAAPPGNPPPPPAANGQEPHRGPPPEALAACKSLVSGAACTFKSPWGAETGTCFAPEAKPLACRPARPLGEGKPGSPEGQVRTKPTK